MNIKEQAKDITEIVSLCKSDKNLLELMKNNITTDFKWKLSISYNIIFILEIIITCCLFCFLLFNIYNEFGLKYIFTIYLTFNIFCIALLIFILIRKLSSVYIHFYGFIHSFQGFYYHIYIFTIEIMVL